MSSHVGVAPATAWPLALSVSVTSVALLCVVSAETSSQAFVPETLTSS